MNNPTSIEGLLTDYWGTCALHLNRGNFNCAGLSLFGSCLYGYLLFWLRRAAIMIPLPLPLPLFARHDWKDRLTGQRRLATDC